MSRSTRLLSIYTRLIRYQSINKTQLSEEFDVSERTVKRDIREIRNYLYDSEEFLDKQDIEFDYSAQEYRIPKKTNINKKQDFETLLLLLIISKVPISSHIVKFLKSIVLEFFMQDKAYLFQLINQIKEKDYAIAHSQLLELQKAINQGNSIQITTLNYDVFSVYPIKIKLQNEVLLLFYSYKKVEYTIPIKQIKDIKIVDIDSQTEQYNNNVILKVGKDMFQHLKQYYEVVSVEQVAEDYIIQFNMSEIEALNLCMTHSSDIKLIGPKKSVVKLKEKLLVMLNTYLID
ncbi:MAG: HTH domain-containing protein [Staphylococcus rostri]|uniref:HTH domain-containing protein n=2 Tax=Staphylococcus rostri TaxID=522262 RepID=UPI0026E0A436|nr:HTH domain-containing protein [Staphylococcus rostri]MDO5376018.1 HTH domain-containing protein [Staphylococcus rostri]